MRRSFLRLVLPRLLGVALALVVSTLALPTPDAALVTVTVGSEAHHVAPGTTLGRLLRDLGVRPSAGRLLDVEGRVLERNTVPGTIHVNGLQASLSVTLHDGDRVLVVDGADRTEGTVRVVTPVGRRPADPQFTLATRPMEEVTVRGRVSGKVASVTYRSAGRIRRPREVALTFDDGPWPRSTRQILEVLERKHVRATFFLVGSLASRHPGLVRLLVRNGMAIGNHSWFHPARPMFRRIGDHRQRTEMARTNRLLARFGVRPRLFRPPGGSYDEDVIETARELGLRVVLWDVDAEDWRAGATRSSIVRNVMRQVRPGSIVLLHDGGGDGSTTAAALSEIIKRIRARGLRLVSLR